MYKIGVLADTHGMLRAEVREILQGCEMIFHGGDINKQQILDELGEIAPVMAVRGNNDKQWAEYLPKSIAAKACGLRVFMVHNKKEIPDDLEDTDLVIYGHSHKYEERTVGGVRYLNPGSCGPRRFHQEITLALLYVEDNGDFRIEKQIIPHPQRSASPEQDGGIPADIASMIPVITREIDAGRTVKQIARKHRISEELSEQIARMYLTHPGVDVDGILRRLGL